jgi:hypothetical protein
MVCSKLAIGQHHEIDLRSKSPSGALDKPPNSLDSLARKLAPFLSNLNFAGTRIEATFSG